MLTGGTILREITGRDKKIKRIFFNIKHSTIYSTNNNICIYAHSELLYYLQTNLNLINFDHLDMMTDH